ncbi:MAG: EamA family transporter [Candidatus Micrarchaeaceae archaeon]
MIAWYYLVLISSVLMGISTILEKMTLKKAHAAAYSAAFTVILLPLSLLFLPFAKFNINLFELLMIYIISVISTVTYVLTARVFRHGNISIASPLFSSLPVLFTIAFAYLFLGEHLLLPQYLSIAVLIVVSYFMIFDTGKNTQGGYGIGKYATTLLMDTILMAVGTILLKYLFILQVNAFAYLIIGEYFMAFNLFLFMTLRYGGFREIVDSIKNYKVPIITIAVLTILYRITNYLAIYSAEVSLTSPLRNSVNVMITVVIGGLMFKEQNLKLKLLLSAVIIIAAYTLIAF